MLFSTQRPDWKRQGRELPNRETSRFVLADGLRWHVQVLGSGPAVLLLHGAGSATHTWRDLAPMLAADFRVIAPDLPGHGFTEMPDGDGLSLPGMARRLSALLARLDVRPARAVGHSAGAAIALLMALEGRIGAEGVVSLNGALRPFPGAAAHLFPAMAKLLALNPVAERLLAWRAGAPGAVERLIASTGSRLDPAGLDYYERLLHTPGHVAGALGMMARWDLGPLWARLPRLTAPATLVAAERDRAVPPDVAEEVHQRLPDSRLIRLAGLGHLAHEEAPARHADIIRDAFAA